ncbi:MAG: hypothetical protein HQL13_06720 [Candidatus Omnitrophica bacterium]|nr:hypothetical protein [Candidatus Omnitrophota bacterium]
MLLGKYLAVVPVTVLLIVFSIFLFITAFLNRDLAMVFLIVAMLLSPQLTIGAVSNRQDIMVRVDDLLVVIFTMVWLARSSLVKNARFIQKFPINRLVLLYCCCCIFSTLKGVFLGQVVWLRGLFFVFKYIEYFFIFYLASSNIVDKKQMVLYLKIFLIVFAIVNLYALSQIGHVDRVSAPFQPKGSEPNTLGGYQVLILGVLIGLLTHASLRFWKWPLIGLALLTMIPFGYTLSRASYMALVPMYLTLVFFNKFATKNILIAVLMVGIALFFVFKPAHIINRLQEAVTPEYQENIPTVTLLGVPLGASASARVDDWIDLFHQWTKEPFFGRGVTGARFVDGQYIKVLVETGLVGFVAFMLLIIMVFRQTLKIYNNSKDGLYRGLAIGFLAGHVGMLVHAISSNTFIIIRIMEPYWFLAAMVMMIPRLENATKEDDQTERMKVNPARNVNFLLQSHWKGSV